MDAIQEFPYWQPLVAIEIIIHFAVLLPLIIFWNLTVFIALIKSKLGNKPLTVLYSSLLLVLCLDKFAQAILTATISSSMLRFCICDILFSLFFQCILQCFFYTGDRFPELATATNHQREKTMEQLQNDHPLHRRKLSSRNVLVCSDTYSELLLPPSSNPCQPLCTQNSTSISEAEQLVIGSYFVSTLLPASTIVTVMSVWSVQLFKKMSIQPNIQGYNTLNKKLLFMPIFMVFIVVCSSPIGYLTSVAFSEVLKLAEVEDYLGNWAYFTRRMSFGFCSCLHGVSYPITLLYFNTKLRKNWKKYLTRKSNRVDVEVITCSKATPTSPAMTVVI